MLRSLVLLAMGLAGCSSSSEAPAAVADAGTTGDAAPADAPTLPDAPRCGDAPYAVQTGTITIRDLGGSKPAAGAKITTAACPGSEVVTAADGTYVALLQKGTATYSRFDVTGALPMIVGEFQVPDEDAFTTDLALLPAIFKGFVPDWVEGTPAIIMGVSSRGMGACADKSGVTITVKDHPEAKIAYLDEATPPGVVAGATSTSASGLLTITNVTGPYVEIEGTKPGCTVTMVADRLTARTPLENGYLTQTQIRLTD